MTFRGRHGFGGTNRASFGACSDQPAKRLGFTFSVTNQEENSFFNSRDAASN